MEFETRVATNRRRFMITALALGTAAGLPLKRAFAANASETAAAAQVVQRLNAALNDVLANGDALKFDGRYQKLQPVLAAVFDIPEMARVATGPKWNDLSDADKQAMTELFGKYMTTMYAARFRGKGGDTLVMGDVKPRDGDKMLVITRLNRKDGEAVELSYLLRGAADTWHVVDVYYNGSISQLAQLRSEFSAPMRDGGIEKLKAALGDKIQQLQGGA
ncbi:MAG TPA: ABC transporter substrate-binding protein [Dongiaceae bacterium]|jgi:phospholipid transport system substrate-binding protein|nr:ABC transporter substrate-binding protein [Dongiaceae bacterium]